MGDRDAPDGSGDVLSRITSAGARESGLGGVVDSLTVGVVAADPDGHAHYVNRAWLDITAQRAGDSLGLGWLDVLAPDERIKERQRITAAVSEQRNYEASWLIAHPSGEERWLRVFTRPERVRVFTGPERDQRQPGGFVATITDITDDRARSAQLLHAATHDSLTGVLNRGHFMEFIRHALDRRRRNPERFTAVLFIDVDRLKRVNDRSGHEAGDRLLVTAAHSIRRVLRPADVVARFGGDEFVVLCDDLHDREEALAIAARIIVAGTAPGNGDAPVGLSVGIAFADGLDDRAEDVIHRADQAMYRAKKSGRGRYELAAPAGATRTTRPSRPARTARAERSKVPNVSADAAQFVAVAAHELRTPLTIVLGLASTLRDRRDRMDPTDVDNALDTVVRQGRRMTVLVEDLLDLAQLTAGPPPPPTRVVLADVVADALVSAPPPESITVNLVESRPGLAVSSNQMGLSRVLVNLLINAYQYGGPVVTVDLRADDHHCELAVADDGAGVPRELVPRLFEPFSRGANSQGKVGSGLGLALSRRLVEGWGGELSFTANGHHGSEFVVRLPAAPSTE